MSTPNQIAANQRNAQLSTGPVTPQGKETASQNSTKHGLNSTRVMANEVPSFEKFVNAYQGKYGPATEMERGHVRRLAELQVRIDRGIAAETAVFDQNIKRLTEADPNLTFEEAVGRIFMDKESATQMRLVLRYQSQAMRLYKQTQKELEDMIKARLIAAEAQLAAKTGPSAPASGSGNGFVSQPVVNQTSNPSRT